MSMARSVIAPVRAVACAYGLSRRWVHRLVARYRLVDGAAFEPPVPPTQRPTRGGWSPTPAKN